MRSQKALIRRKLHAVTLFSLLLLLMQPAWAIDGNGAIKGKVTTTEGKPVDGATIQVEGTRYETVSEEDGTFLLQNVKPGTYKLVISFLGKLSATRQVTIKADETLSVSLSLELSPQQLHEVTVTNGYNKFNKKETNDIARLPLRNIENPQVYTVVTKEIMEEQQVTDYNSIFKNVPGAGVPVVYNQGRSALLARGFTTANLIRNSVSGFVYTNIDPANIERLEAIKGPSGTLFNSSMISYGGLFNRVTKKPNETRKRSISYTGGSFDLNRLTFDINNPLNDDNTVLMRMNGALHTEQSFQDAGFTRSIMLAPSLIYKASDRLTFLLDVEGTVFNATSPIRFAPSSKGSVHNIEDLGMDYKRSFTNNTLDYNTRQLNFFGQINYQLSPQWKLQTNYTRTYSATKGYVTQLIGKTDSTLQQRVQKENFPYNGTEIQQNLIGDFTIHGLRNRMVVGVDFYNQRSERSTPTINLPVINFKNPGDAYYNFNADYVDALAASAAYSVYRTNQYTYGGYVSDVLNITSKLNAMLSLRFDHFDNKGRFDPATATYSGAFTQNALSPKLGLVYEILKDQLSVFGNYMNGFSNVTGVDYEGNTFKPEHANQWEFGVKADAFGHRLSSTISYYNIEVANVTREDPEHADFSLQDGTQLSKGLEVEVIANPIDGLNIVAGYAYNDSKMTKADKDVEGLRPGGSGPEHLGNAWISYRVQNGGAKGLGVGIGGNYGSESFQTNTTDFVFTIPSYTVLDATVFYDQPTWRLGIKVDNLTGEKYWSYRLAPQLPTRVTANITFRF